MEDKDNDSRFAPLRAPGAATPQEIEEARALADRLLDHRITDQERDRFEQLVVSYPDIAAMYVEMVHLWCNLPLHLPRTAFDRDAAERSAALGTPASMHETFILPAIREIEGEEEPPLFFPTVPAARREGRKVPFRVWWASAAAVIVGAVVLWAVLHRQTAQRIARVDRPETSTGRGSPHVDVAVAPAPPVVVVPPAAVTATAGMNADDHTVSPGMALAIGRPLHLAAGAVELRFASGAVTTIQGPARFAVLSSNSMRLEDGSLAARVPVPAHGFRVDAPGLSIVDRGTEFGIHASATRAASDVCIFKGVVDATGVNSSGQPTAAPVRAVAGEALRHRVTDAALVPVAYKPQGFIRNISDVRLGVPLHNTGEHVAAGAIDPNWMVVSVPDDPAWQPKPASVIQNLTAMYTSDTEDLKWIGVTNQMDNQPAGKFVFRTSVDLADRDPASIQISADIAADDCVSDILINGVSTGASNSPDNPGGKFLITRVKLPAAPWHQGLNRVDVVVLNRPNQNVMNCMLLQVRWSATVAARVHRWTPSKP